jgi:hypothetical protein
MKTENQTRNSADKLRDQSKLWDDEFGFTKKEFINLIENSTK